MDRLDETTTMIGGKMLGQGAYGCVFDKPLACKSGVVDTKGKIGKLTLKSEAKMEKKLSSMLQAIPNAADYFGIIFDECPIKPRKNQKDPDLNKCEIINKYGQSQYTQITMRYGGKSLDELRGRFNTKMINYYDFARHILEAGALLLSKGIVHNDLHMGNVLLGPTKKPMIIDFGLSYQISMLTEKNTENLLLNTFDPKYKQHAPELSILDALYNGIPLKENIYPYILEKKKSTVTLEKIWGVSFKKGAEDLKTFTATSKSIRDRDWLSFYKIYWPKLDAWAVGRILLNIYEELSFDSAFKEDAILTPKYKKVISGLLETTPNRRLNCAQALSILEPQNPLLKAKGVAVWI
jgi:serine/threonine protein kinase